MSDEPTYTFTFVIQGRTEDEDHKTVRQVPFSKLLESFDAAYEWRMAGPRGSSKPIRYASVYGPGMYERTVNEETREYILSFLPEHMKRKRTVIGIAWIDITHDHHKEGSDHRAYKILRSELLLADMPDRPQVVYDIEEIDPEDWQKALDWARANFRYEFGVWVHSRPGIVFTPDFEEISTALLRMPEANDKLSVDRELPTKVIRSPVRFDWKGHDNTFPYIAPTRNRWDVQKLRSEFPNAHLDLAFAPREALIRLYGYPKPKVMG